MRDLAFFPQSTDPSAPQAMLLSVVSSVHIPPGSTLSLQAGSEEVTLTFVNAPESIDEIPILPQPSRMAGVIVDRLRVLAPWIKAAGEPNQAGNNIRIMSTLGVVQITTDSPGLLTVQPIFEDVATEGSAFDPGGDFRLNRSGDVALDGPSARIQTAIRVRTFTAVDRTLLGTAASPEGIDQIADRVRLGLERDGFFSKAEVVGTLDPTKPGTGLFAIRVPSNAELSTVLATTSRTKGFRFI